MANELTLDEIIDGLQQILDYRVVDSYEMQCLEEAMLRLEELRDGDV
jgi:hypothetical protein